MKRINSIMLVEDDNITNFINERLLRKLDIAGEINIVVNGSDALNTIKNTIEKGSMCPNLILLDINMPVMDGFEFLNEFKKLTFSGKKDVVIIVLTTSTNVSDINKLKNAGNTDFINKPLTREKVITIMSKYFRHINIASLKGAF